MPNWAYYDDSIRKIKDLVNALLSKSIAKKFFEPLKKSKQAINSSLFSLGINAFFKFYEVNQIEDLILKNNQRAFSDEFAQGTKNILRTLHHEIFNSMDSCQKKVEEAKENSVLI